MNRLLQGFGVGLIVTWFGIHALIDAQSAGGPIAAREKPKGDSMRPANPHGLASDSKADPHAKGNPHAKGKPPHGGANRAEESFAKVHFMKKFLKALRQPPGNKWPAADYRPLLKPGVTMNCSGCHDPAKLNMEGMLKNDPGHHAVEKFRKNPNFMIPLMQKWLARLNRSQGDKLTKPATCNDCHAISPAQAWNSLPPLMVNFVQALKTRPVNKDPASRWKPLLKDATSTSMLCGSCHGDVGKAMERDVGKFASAPRPGIAGDKAFMKQLMHRWVDQLNRDAKSQLVKRVTCLDCHEKEPKG